MTTREYLNKLKRVDLIQSAEEILRETEDELIEHEKDQLYAGQDGNERHITPTYLTDPFFKTKKAARAYARYKAGLNQRSAAYYLAPKPYATPNLIITGRLVYNRLKLYVQGDRFSVAPAEKETGSMLERKYGALFKLNPTVLGEYKRRVFNKRMAGKIKKILS